MDGIIVTSSKSSGRCESTRADSRNHFAQLKARSQEMAISDVLVLSGGDLSDDVAERVRARLSTLGLNARPVSMSKSKAFKTALVEDATSTTTLGERT